MAKKYTEADIERVRAHYARSADEWIPIRVLADDLGRTVAAVTRFAGKLGLHDPDRFTKPLKTKPGHAGKWDRHPHPRPMRGKSHTPEARERMSRSQRAAAKHWSEASRQSVSDAKALWHAANRDSPTKGYRGQKDGRRPDLDNRYFRSAWEANYARYLNWLVSRGEIEGWDYEPETFWFEAIRRGTRSYKPDFRIKENGNTYYVEVKGWMDAASKTKLRRMKKYHPAVRVVLVDSQQYRAIEKSVSGLIPNWERRGAYAVQ